MTANAELMQGPEMECTCGVQPFAIGEILLSDRGEISTVFIECRRCGRKTGQFYHLHLAKSAWRQRYAKNFSFGDDPGVFA
jgi:hypothetical protein